MHEFYRRRPSEGLVDNIELSLSMYVSAYGNPFTLEAAAEEASYSSAPCGLGEDRIRQLPVSIGGKSTPNSTSTHPIIHHRHGHRLYMTNSVSRVRKTQTNKQTNKS